MAVTKIPIQFRLGVRFNMGLNENFEPVFRIRSWRGVKSTVSPENLHQLGTYIGQLCAHTLDRVQVDETFELEQA